MCMRVRYIRGKYFKTFDCDDHTKYNYFDKNIISC